MIKRLLIILILFFACFFCYFGANGQKYLLTSDLIEVDMRVDSMFRENFILLENYEQTFIVPYPEYSTTDFNEPTNTDVYKFVDLLVKVTGIKCDSIIKQKNWEHAYCSWNNEKIKGWEIWYMKNCNELKWEQINAVKNEIEENWKIIK